MINELMDRHLATHAALDPVLATRIGLPGHENRLPDLSPEGLSTRADLRRFTLALLDAMVPATADERVTATAARDQLETAELLRETGAEESCLNNTDSPLQAMREVFDLMAADTVDDWADVADRLHQVPQALAGYRASLRYACSRGRVSPRRQILTCLPRCSDAGRFFASLAASASRLPQYLTSRLDRGAERAARAYADLAVFLREELLPDAPRQDAVGREHYALLSRRHLGIAPDLAEVYAWGQEELARIGAAMRETADRIQRGATVEEAAAVLTADPARRLQGTEALLAWMQERSDESIGALAGSHFEIPEPIRALECRIAPTPNGGIHYTGPSEDLSRPGRMWWSIPAGVREFSTWRELTTIHHEGVPGRHLRIAHAVRRRDRLGRWRALASSVDGHSNGWALYAEALMAELGFLDDPGNLLGMLDSQSFRAVGVVIDIGFHCGFPAPAAVGGGAWTYGKAWRLLTAHSGKPKPRLRYELDRYLGLPAQAASYKIGERFWLELREEERRRRGKAFSLRDFHRRSLDVGGIGLDVLRAAVLGEFDGAAQSGPNSLTTCAR